MTQDDFLASYDPSAFPQLAVTVDLILLGLRNQAPTVLVLQRNAQPFEGFWALPGGFVGERETLEAAALRVMQDKAGIETAHLEQLYTFGTPDRDPRMRIVSVAYLALLNEAAFTAALRQNKALLPARIEAPLSHEDAVAISVRNEDDEVLQLAFDHAEILATAIHRLRGKLDYSPVGFALLPEQFTLRQLQDVHEAISGRALNKPAFRRRMQDKGWISPTGTREEGTSFRPAELFLFNDRPQGD
ncbi:NUDIX domain-containing protein [Tianweitania populi]|uniref:NUDIX hydrolase n=1 Tax=Tianweitania populi TaxID=1607949 RepID=A0A8J3DKI7_9HYPH|nr:NUDIX domain-containing protein [Tianweitania populi]GHD05202.1 NUDIX hydrolase [Tianweitania populi]